MELLLSGAKTRPIPTAIIFTQPFWGVMKLVLRSFHGLRLLGLYWKFSLSQPPVKNGMTGAILFAKTGSTKGAHTELDEIFTRSFIRVSAVLKLHFFSVGISKGCW